MYESDLPPLPLPDGITSTYIDCTSSCGLNFHILTSGSPQRPDGSPAPLVLFTHGYPELAYSWRHVLPAVAAHGYFCVAPDQRSYGRTTSTSSSSKPSGNAYETADLHAVSMPSLVRDLVCLVYGLGRTAAAAIVGHDFGAVVSAHASLIRPDVFRATVQLSHPHHKPPAPPLGPGLGSGTGRGDDGGAKEEKEKKEDIHAALAALTPPRKHYKWYNSTATAARDWDRPGQGLARFLRGYFHVKSADWERNAPRPLGVWSARELEVMPGYYIMPLRATMPEVVSELMEGEDEARTEAWLTGEELEVYVAEWERTGFQGALNWYRAATELAGKDGLLYAGKRLEVPCMFVSGIKDWGNYQQPGAFEGYEDAGTVKEGCFRGMKLVDGAGHWVQQEKPEVVAEEVLKFLKSL